MSNKEMLFDLAFCSSVDISTVRELCEKLAAAPTADVDDTLIEIRRLHREHVTNLEYEADDRIGRVFTI